MQGLVCLFSRFLWWEGPKSEQISLFWPGRINFPYRVSLVTDIPQDPFKVAGNKETKRRRTMPNEDFQLRNKCSERLSNDVDKWELFWLWVIQDDGCLKPKPHHGVKRSSHCQENYEPSWDIFQWTWKELMHGQFAGKTTVTENHDKSNQCSAHLLKLIHWACSSKRSGFTIKYWKNIFPVIKAVVNDFKKIICKEIETALTDNQDLKDSIAEEEASIPDSLFLLALFPIKLKLVNSFRNGFLYLNEENKFCWMSWKSCRKRKWRVILAQVQMSENM